MNGCQMSNQEKVREVASFFYSFNGPQPLVFETFVKEKKKILGKISAYDFDEWTLAIERAADVEESLCFLVVNYGHRYQAMKSGSSKARLHLLQVWEKHWGKLPTKWRVGFIRHAGFSEIQWLDIAILEYMFTQHRKFESVIDHLIGLQLGVAVKEFSFDFSNENYHSESLTVTESDSDPNFDNEAILVLSHETSIPLDWNIDDLDTDDILPVWDDEFSY